MNCMLRIVGWVTLSNLVRYTQAAPACVYAKYVAVYHTARIRMRIMATLLS